MKAVSEIKVQPVIDPLLGEDVSWRFWWMHHNLDVLPNIGPHELTFERKTWTRPEPEWDHDHCAGCFARFTDLEIPDSHQIGWATRWGERIEEWLCDDCHRLLQDAANGNLKVNYEVVTN
jgi:hypothetical protein